MNTKFRFRSLVFGVLMLFVAFAAACTKDTTESPVSLHYMDIGDIGPSMYYTSNPPSYQGATPSEFAVDGVKRNGEHYNDAEGCFTVNAQSGAVQIANTELLTTGTYSLTISCLAGGQRNVFSDIVSVRMIAATPIAVDVTPAVLAIEYDTAKDSPLTAQVSPKDEAVTPSGYALIQEEGKEYFTISNKGVIGINKKFTDEILPGIYKPGLKVTSLAGSAVYEDVVTLKITSKPLSVTYRPAEGRAEVNNIFSSPSPTIKGSDDQGLQWAIKAVVPQTDKFKIDAATGVLSLEADNGFAVGDQFSIDVAVSNQYGSTDFAAVYAVKVVAYIAPINPATFGYDAAETVEGESFSAKKKSGFVGDEATFAFGQFAEKEAAIADQLTIDDQTGAVLAKKGHSIPIGTYSIPVVATNPKGAESANLALEVKANPYYFTTISYGNNLGLTPATSYASQFRCATVDDLEALSGVTPTTDAKSGTELSWSVKMTWKMSGTTINAATGALTFPASAFDDKAKTGMLVVTATAGLGQKGETSVSIPICFVFTSGISNGIGVSATPFVFKINPRKGGISEVPLTVTGVSDMSKFLIDFRRTFQYFNVNGPASHINGQPSVAGAFMRTVCEKYAEDTKAPSVPYGAKDMLSYYINQPKNTLDAAIAYIDPATLKLVVNPSKWRTNDGYANGCFFGEMTYITNGVVTDINTGTTTRPFWIWFDEKF